MKTSTHSAPSLLSLVLGFAVIYVVWGSTYLAIKFAIETLPPFLMAGARFLTAGLLMYVVLIARGEAVPNRNAWRSATVLGALMLLGGNGLVTWSEQWVPSGVAALIVGTIPLWIMLLQWQFWGGTAPSRTTVAGMAVGFGGVALLVDRATLEGEQGGLLPFLAILAAPLLWAIGSLQSRTLKNHSPMLFSAMQMITGGAMMLIFGLLMGETRDLQLAAVSTRSLAAFVYLVLAGSILAFSVYTWLIRVASPSAVSTYAYVNPLVAVLLGWSLGDEAVHANMIVATVLIVGAVALITLKRRPQAAPVAAKVEPAVDAKIAEDDPQQLRIYPEPKTVERI